MTQLQVSVPNNRALLARGLRMTSVFDYDGLGPDARLLLSGEPCGSYLFGAAPVQMKILDGRRVVLQGPFLEGEQTLMALSSPECMAAARRYWEAVLASAFPAVEAGQGLDHLTERQRRILALLAADAKDEAIAAALGVSVRTVRADVAAVMSLLGVRSRFAAGLRVRRQVSVETER
jgi:DNA-binding CsgD family transcriptional regulator